jgi:hypothetical protein
MGKENNKIVIAVVTVLLIVLGINYLLEPKLCNHNNQGGSPWSPKHEPKEWDCVCLGVKKDAGDYFFVPDNGLYDTTMCRGIRLKFYEIPFSED